MHVTIIGTGYVGLVSGTCFADMGNQVVCLDVDAAKIKLLQAGGIPIYEPGLEALVQHNVREGNLSFTTDYDAAVRHAEVLFIAVGTPPDEDGSADLRHVLAVARAIGQRIEREVVVVDKSTVPVGTAARVQQAIAEELARRGVQVPFHVVSNPEFLKEGSAVADFQRADRIVVGCASEVAERTMRRLYEAFSRKSDKLMFMDVPSAELTKYAANAMLATRISFMNELANLAERVGANIDHVRRGIGSDSRIGMGFLYAGVGYGGSCFPKDVKALLKTARDEGHPLRVLAAVEAANEAQKEVLYAKLLRHFGGAEPLRGKTIALWGLAFKPDTDDIREAPSLVLTAQLLACGAKVRAYDPVAGEVARSRLAGEIAAGQVTICEHAYDALQDADALALLTEWRQFRNLDVPRAAQLMRSKVVFDGRNALPHNELREAGFTHYRIGMPDPMQAAGAAPAARVAATQA